MMEFKPQKIELNPEKTRIFQTNPEKKPDISIKPDKKRRQELNPRKKTNIRIKPGTKAEDCNKPEKNKYSETTIIRTHNKSKSVLVIPNNFTNFIEAQF